MTTNLYYDIHEDKIVFDNVSNMDSGKITRALKQAARMLKCIDKSSEHFGGTETKLFVYIDLTFEEATLLEKRWQEKMIKQELRKKRLKGI